MVEAMAQERGLIATFMPKPFAHLTGNGGHFHMSLWDGDTNVFDRGPRRRPARPRPQRDRLPVHRRAEEARQGLHRVHRADGLVLQAAGDRRADQRRDLGAGVRHLRLEQPDADAPHPRRGADRGPDRGRLLQPVPGGDGDPRRRPGRDRERPRSRASRPRSTCTRPARRTGERWGSRRCRPTCSTRPASSRATRCCARPSGRSATRTTSTTSSAASGASGSLAHEQITQWEIDRYLQLY